MGEDKRCWVLVEVCNLPSGILDLSVSSLSVFWIIIVNFKPCDWRNARQNSQVLVGAFKRCHTHIYIVPFTNQRHLIFSSNACLLLSFPLVNRRWAHLVTKEKATTWTSGQFSAGDPCGSARRPSASATRPPTRCCQWRGSSTDVRSTVRGRFTPCRAPASTASGRPWRAYLWSPVRFHWAAETTVTNTRSSDLDSSPLLQSPSHCSVCLPLYSYLCTRSSPYSRLIFSHSLTFTPSFHETVPKSVMNQGTTTSSFQSLAASLTFIVL